MPVALRNYAVGGGFYLTTSQFGPNFYIGNNPQADGTYASLRFGRGAPEYERTDATELAEHALGRTLTPAEVSGFWTGRALDFITTHPGAWLALEARKALLLVNATEMLDTEAQESHAEYFLAAARRRLVRPLRPSRTVGAGRARLRMARPRASGCALRDARGLQRQRRAVLRLRAVQIAARADAAALRGGGSHGVARLGPTQHTSRTRDRVCGCRSDGYRRELADAVQAADDGDHRNQPRGRAPERRPSRRGRHALRACHCAPA
ncbi:MAG: hypothetical protein QM736_18125 [Vicinamibacterales bacterium]